ncbi:MAG: MATE family efflux transporter [Clostridia bacterium]|nr:MATE family efflux transporter [Clostridia bacterium]
MTNHSQITESELFPRGYIKKLLLPLVIEQFLAVTIGLADTIMVSSNGDAAISGVSLVDQINVLLIQVFAALATGGAIVVSQYVGRNEKENARAAAKQLFLITTLAACVIMALCLCFCPYILRMIFGAVEDSVMQNCKTYFYMSVISYPFLALYNSGAAMFRSMGKSRITMYISIVMNTINVAGNAIFIFGFGMSVFGAALATLISRATGAVIITTMAHNKNNPIYVDFKSLRLKFSLIKRILYVGVPNGIENGMFQIGKLMVSRIIADLGTAAIAANSVSGTVAMVSNIPGSAIGLGLVTIVGQAMGAGLPKTAEKYSKKLLGLTYLLTNILNILIFVLAPFVIAMYSELSPEATKDALRIVRVFCIVSSVTWPLAFTLPNSLRAAGDVRFTLVVSMSSMWLCRVALCYLLCYTFNMGLDGVWYAMYADWMFRIIFFVTRFAKGKWKSCKVI